MTPEQLEAHRVRFEQHHPETRGLTSLYSLSGNIKDYNRLVLTVAELHAYVDADRAQRAAPGVQGGEALEVDGRKAYHDGRGAYEREYWGPGKPVAGPFSDLDKYEKARWIVIAATAQQTPPAAVEMGPVLIDGIAYQRPVIRVAVVTVDGASCTVPVGDLLDMLEDTGKCTVEIKTMSKREFDELPEFTGF